MGDGGQTRASKKLPDAVRYSPPRLPNSKPTQDPAKDPRGGANANSVVPNGHVNNGRNASNPPSNGYGPQMPKDYQVRDGRDSKGPDPSPPPQYQHQPSRPADVQRKDSELRSKPQQPQQPPQAPKDQKPAAQDQKRDGYGNNNNNNHRGNVSNQGNVSNHNSISSRNEPLPRYHDKPRYYDDSELPIRRQQMESQGWPRDPKDYLIGGIYGPEPKSKPNESQHQNQGQPQKPSQQQQQQQSVKPQQPAKPQGGKPAGREPYRSRSFPRDSRAPGVEDPARNRRPANNLGGRRPGGNAADKAFSLVDAQDRGDVGKKPSRNRGRGQAGRFDDLDDDGMADLERAYPRDGLSPVRNGPKAGPKSQAARNRAPKPQWNANARKAQYDEAVVTSDIINNDGLNSYKARLITFYKNGDTFFPGIKISMKPGRDFSSFEALCNYLTPRTDLPAGVRYIFSLDGRKVRGLDDLEDGGQYVCSSRKKYLHLNYGMGKNDWKPHSKFTNNQEDWKLFRPPSPGSTGVANRERRSPEGQPGSREGRVIRVINNDDHTIQSRILLNLRTAQPWEEVIQDLGQALRMPAAKRMFTYTGQEVQSFSQLRNDYREVDTFYLCTEHDIREPAARGRGRSRANTKSHSPPAAAHVDPVRVKIKGQRREVYPPMNQRYQREESPPDKSMELNWVYGYRGHDTRLNLTLLPTGELLYYVAAVAVLFDRIKNRQRHYTGHTEDIQCMTLHPTRELCATGQKEGKGRHSRAQVHVWDIDTLSTQMVIGINDVENGIVAVSFSTKNLGQHLLIVDDSPEHVLSIWNWKSKRLLSKAPIHRPKIIGGQFIPREDTQSVTFGESHLTIWRRLKDGGFDRDDLLDDDAKTITCVEFDDEGDQYLITGDTDGNITLWADNRNGIFQSMKVLQAHMRSVSAMLMLPEGTLLSSGGNEKDRYIKAWDSNHNYRAITFTRLPESAGGVRSLCQSKLDSTDLGIFAGTSKNMILEGSIHRRFKIVVQGHHRQLTALAVDPDEPAFVTAGYDRSISRWAMHKLVWKVQVQSECTCLSIHPMGEVVAVGTTDGHFIVLTLHRGMHVATLPASKQVITCLAYSPDGSSLAVALEEGSVSVYSVSGRGYAYRRMKIMRGYDPIIQMDWSRDGKSIQSVTADYNSILWDMIAMEIEKIPSSLRDVRWHTITCTLSYTVNGIWNNVNQMIDTINTTCCGSASEKLLISGDDEGYLRIFRYPAITPRSDFHEIKAQSSRLNTVRFLYDDSFVITIGGEDAVLMQWMIVHAK